MSTRIRNMITIGGGLAVAGALAAFVATGMYPYTRFRSESLAEANSETGLTDLLSEAGAGDAPPPAAIDNVTALGLLPSGPGASSLSVVTLAGPAVVLVAGAWLWDRRARKKGVPAVGHDQPSAAQK